MTCYVYFSVIRLKAECNQMIPVQYDNFSYHNQMNFKLFDIPKDAIFTLLN